LSLLRLPFTILPYLTKVALFLLTRGQFVTVWRSNNGIQLLRILGDGLNFWLTLAIAVGVFADLSGPLQLAVMLATVAEATRLITEKGQMLVSAGWQLLPYRSIAMRIPSAWAMRGPLTRYVAYYRRAIASKIKGGKWLMRSESMDMIRPFASLEECFGDVPDPRVVGRCDHLLVEIIMVAVCAVLCGAESWSEVEEFGPSKMAWLKQYLALPAGIPSHDTFGRVFRLLDAQVFQERFIRWVEGTFKVERGQVIAVDGKTARGSRDSYRGQDAIELVSAFAHESGLLLGQRKVDDQSNEITAVPELLKTLFIRGCVVRVDALNCQKDIAQTIIEAGGDYVLALKANHPVLHQEVVDWFEWAKA